MLFAERPSIRPEQNGARWCEPAQPAGHSGDHLGRHERVRSRAAAEVEHALAGLEPAEREGIGDPRERIDAAVGDGGELVGIAEILGPSAACGEDEVLLGLGRDARVGLLDLALERCDVDLNFDGRGGKATPGRTAPLETPDET
jgi:hypothetical protein